MTDIAKDGENFDHLWSHKGDPDPVRFRAWQAVNVEMIRSYWEVASRGIHAIIFFKAVGPQQ